MPDNETGKGSWQDFAVRLSLLLIMILAGAAMFYLMSRPKQTGLETALEAIILTLASIVASFLITKVYAEASYNQTLRDHGVQIAGGIMVLKRQIEALTEWVAQKRSSLPSSNRFDPSDSILEHVEQTLLGFRGMTDSALGGIAGVIGDALAQYEAIMEQVSTIRSESLQKVSKIEKQMETATGEDLARFEAELKQIVTQTDKEVAKLARSSALPIPEPPPRRLFTETCPSCSRKNAFEMLDRVGETQVIRCDFCDRTFNAHVNGSHRVITRALYSSSHPRRVTDLQSRVKQILVDTAYWVEPIQLEPLIPLVISSDQRLKNTAATRSPFNLQAMILEGNIALEQVGISRGAVRTLLKIVYRGKVFQFSPGNRPAFKTPYHNDLTVEGLLNSFIHACIERVSNLMRIDSGQAPELASLLLADRFEDSEALVSTAITALNARTGAAVSEISLAQSGVETQGGGVDMPLSGRV